jgi:hypothetical protein
MSASTAAESVYQDAPSHFSEPSPPPSWYGANAHVNRIIEQHCSAYKEQLFYRTGLLFGKHISSADLAFVRLGKHERMYFDIFSYGEVRFVRVRFEYWRQTADDDANHEKYPGFVISPTWSWTWEEWKEGHEEWR